MSICTIFNFAKVFYMCWSSVLVMLSERKRNFLHSAPQPPDHPSAPGSSWEGTFAKGTLRRGWTLATKQGTGLSMRR